MSTINALWPGRKCVSGFTGAKFKYKLRDENTFVKVEMQNNYVCYNLYFVHIVIYLIYCV